MDYLVITVDLPGHGLTGSTPAGDYTYTGMANFLKEFTQSLEIKEFYLSGNSMGGAVSLQYILSYPDDILGLILVDSAGVDIPKEAQQKVHYPLVFQLAGHWYSSWLVKYITPRSLAGEGLITAVADPAVLNSAMIDRYWELGLHPGNREATNKRFAWYRDGKTTLPVENITVPTLILWGKEDRIIPVAVADEFKRRIQNSKLHIFDTLGHIPMEESPLTTVKPVIEFLDELSRTQISSSGS